MKDLGNRIQELRKQHKLSQVEFAKKVDISKSQLIRYEGKGVQPPAHTLNKMAELFGTSVDYLINGNTGEKAQSTLRDAELIKQFRHIEELPEDEKNTIIKVITAYVRDFKTRQAYVM